MVEADPAGGDLAARHHLPANPGLVSLAAAARRQSSAALLAQHSQRLPGGLRVVPGPVAAEQARAALGVLTTRGVRATRAAAAAPDAAILVDVGRLDSSSPALPLVRGADSLVVVARPRADELSHVATMLGDIPKWARMPALLLVGDGYSRAEVEHELRVPVMGTMPDDAPGAAPLCGRQRGRAPEKSAIGRAAARIAANLVAQAQHPPSSAAPSHDEVAEFVTANGNGGSPR
ncbi:chromosome partitioning protein [Saccharomonospora sp. CUA-673]|uniref:chromosome partitioning protein n=1 Tax=Saccharomonospora sp. CUA-673 TaxID=1904969 RepID=UPI001651954C|nr:chromosome partitioning protein [Saccharomonospora sp. CUA-673]